MTRQIQAPTARPAPTPTVQPQPTPTAQPQPTPTVQPQPNQPGSHASHEIRPEQFDKPPGPRSQPNQLGSHAGREPRPEQLGEPPSPRSQPNQPGSHASHETCPEQLDKPPSSRSQPNQPGSNASRETCPDQTGKPPDSAIVTPPSSAKDTPRGWQVGSLALVPDRQLIEMARTGHSQTTVVDPASGRLVAIGLRPAPPGRYPNVPAVTWDWVDPTTWPTEMAASPTYTPSDWLTLLVMIRDQTCRWPGCIVPATSCQIDHHQPFDANKPAISQTRAGNLGCLCLQHHQVKHADLWTVRRNSATGATIWSHSDGTVRHKPPDLLNLT